MVRRIRLLKLSGKVCLKRELRHSNIKGVSHLIICIPRPSVWQVQKAWGRSLPGSVPLSEASEDQHLSYFTFYESISMKYFLFHCFL